MKESWNCFLINGHLEVQPDGLVFPCCASMTPEPLGNLHENSLMQIWESSQRKNVINHFQKGQGFLNPHCKSCKKQEECGLKSERQKENERWIDKGLSQDENLNAPISLGVRFSNRCNFSCRMCHPSASTSWILDAKFMNPKGNYKLRTSSSKNNPLWRQVSELLDKGLKRIYFAGGEPLLEKDHYLLLEEVIKKNHNCLIEYDTNFSILNHGEFNVLEMWGKLKNVVVSISLDGFGQKGEYIRKGLEWKRLDRNLTLLKKECPHVKVSINFVLNNYNVFHLKDFVKFIYSPDFPIASPLLNISFCESPSFLDVKRLPSTIKDLALKELYEFQDVCDYLKSSNDEISLEKFHSSIKLMDFLRGESYKETFPLENEIFFGDD